VSLRERFGWNDFFERQIGQEERTGLQWARVVEEQRGLYRVAGDVDGWVEVSGRFRHEAVHSADYPAVGDWVGVEQGIVHRRLDRRSTVSRAAAGRAVDQQVLTANVETIFLVTTLGQDLNARRLERYLTMVWDAGAVPVVLLNKSDLSEDPDAERDSVRARLPLVDVLIVSALQPDELGGLDALAPYLRPAQTVALLGSSGVGKSTIINRLVGREALKTRAISDTNGKGRHTTTSRQLVALPGGALLIDTPGMRELQPWADASAVDAAFDDIAALAGACRFADCGHASEPGCAVRDAVDSGRLDADRLENYRRLGREAAFEERKRNKAAAAEEKRRWKQIHQAQKALYKERDRGSQ
jgi:ribosome biogenesis GTPase / thiamine phosphate phosphatase